MSEGGVAVIGRDKELATIGDFLSARDLPAALVLEGEPGIGKTALLRRGIAEAGFYRVLAAGGDPDALLTALGSALLREDRNFHTVQMVEASFRQWDRRPDHVLLVAAARYLAAHAPTVRVQGQTFSIAHRLHRGERLYDEE